MYIGRILLFMLFIFLQSSNGEIPKHWKSPHSMEIGKHDIENGKMNGKLPSHWVDPHDMRQSNEYLNYFPDENDPKDVKKYHVKNSCNCESQNRAIEAYYKRTLNMLLNSVHEDMNNEDTFSGYIFFKIDLEKYEALKTYANGRSGDIHKIDNILSEIFEKPTTQYLEEFFKSWFHRLLVVTMTREGIATIILFVYLFVFYKMFRANFNFWYMSKFGVVNFLIFDFGWTWMHLYQNAQIDKLAESLKYQRMPVYCDPEKMSTWQFIWNSFSSEDECKKYHYIMYKDILWSISPGTVVTEMFTRTLVYPAKAIGTATGDLFTGILNALPWPLGYIILPLALIFFLIMTCIILSFLCRIPLNFNFFFNLISLSFGESSRSQKDQISGKNMEKLLDIAAKTQNFERKFVEIIKSLETNNSSDSDIEITPTKNKKPSPLKLKNRDESPKNDKWKDEEEISEVEVNKMTDISVEQNGGEESLKNDRRKYKEEIPDVKLNKLADIKVEQNGGGESSKTDTRKYEDVIDIKPSGKMADISGKENGGGESPLKEENLEIENVPRRFERGDGDK